MKSYLLFQQTLAFFDGLHKKPLLQLINNGIVHMKIL